MPGLAQKNAQLGHSYSNVARASITETGIWSRHRGDVTFDQLQEFWSELSPEARQRLLRIDKHALFEQARKNLYCSRCNGLLLEGFSQIVIYGKSLKREGSRDEAQDPAVHPWGGLATTRDGMLTLLDCFLVGKSLKALQEVFDSARERERERELLYPDACGGSGRGWISQGVSNYGRGHGIRETCALHTARLSCDTLVDFWTALGDESRQSLLKMKEDDFIERLIYRFDSKRFCRDCRRNVIREFKELKELKRMHREPRCNNWFCVSDGAFQYEVSDGTIQVDWHQSFNDAVGTYHHFEWAVGTVEGKSDILEFEDVGLERGVQVDGLDLGHLSSFFITLRAWRLDGRCTELSVKAHALKGQYCIHHRLVVGDGFVSITKGESIRRFFEHAEEAEEEEDDDALDKEEDDLDVDNSRSQKHAKSPELAREFLLDAATVIFKEQVEKAFREGTARQNAHSMFVCLALKLLEERVHVACREIITLEKQIKLLEEEEKEKHEEEVRRERRRMKEREKKLRKKERLKGKIGESEKPKEHRFSSSLSCKKAYHEELNSISNSPDSTSETGENSLTSSFSSDMTNEQFSSQFIDMKTETVENGKQLQIERFSPFHGDCKLGDDECSFMMEVSKSSRRKWRCGNEVPGDLICQQSFPVHPAGQLDNSVHISPCCADRVHRQIRRDLMKFSVHAPKVRKKFHCSNNRIRDKYDPHSCSRNRPYIYRLKEGSHVSLTRPVRNSRCQGQLHSKVYVSARSLHHQTTTEVDMQNGDDASSRRGYTGSSHFSKCEAPQAKKVWEPHEMRKRCFRSTSGPDVMHRLHKTDETVFQQPANICTTNDDSCCAVHFETSSYVDASSCCEDHKGDENSLSQRSSVGSRNRKNTINFKKTVDYCFGDSAKVQRVCDTVNAEEEVGATACSNTGMNSVNSDNCSSLSKSGDSTLGSSVVQHPGSACTSDSKGICQHSGGETTSSCAESASHNLVTKKLPECLVHRQTGCMNGNYIIGQTSNQAVNFYTDGPVADNGSRLLPVCNRTVHMQMFPAPLSVGYCHQNTPDWTVGLADGFIHFSQPSHYLLSGSPSYGRPVNLQSSYLSVQYTASRLHNLIQDSVQQPMNKASPCDSKNDVTSLLSSAQRTSHVVPAAVNKHPSIMHPTETVSETVPSVLQECNLTKAHSDVAHFSLFHFGGPMMDLSTKMVGIPVGVDHACSKEQIIEEYSLFAKGTNSMFSIPLRGV